MLLANPPTNDGATGCSPHSVFSAAGSAHSPSVGPAIVHSVTGSNHVAHNPTHTDSKIVTIRNAVI